MNERRVGLIPAHATGHPSEEAKEAIGVEDRTVSVTLRMPAWMIDALKAEARRQGLRGYQTLMKQWIDERLNGEPSISTTKLTAILAKLYVAQEDLARLVEDHDDGRD